jgi:4-hydroxy-tetrahydrodipicolinate synthase
MARCSAFNIQHSQFHRMPIHGIAPIVAAPFTAAGALDEDSLQGLVRHLLGTGASALTLFGLATEFYKLADAERERMQAILLAETSRSPDVAGVISITDHSWELAVQRARAAEAQGADALMLLPPYFLGPAEAAILDHLRRVIAAVSIPVIVQYAPAQTGVRLPPEVFLTLREELPNADFVKVETQPPGPYVSRLIERSGGRLRPLVGYAGVQMPDVLARGAAGIQPGCSFTEVYVQLWRRHQAGDLAGFLELHGQLLPYIGYWMQGVELIVRAEKRILQRRGLIASDYCRSPSYALDPVEEAQIEQFLAQFAPWLPAPRAIP